MKNADSILKHGLCIGIAKAESATVFQGVATNYFVDITNITGKSHDLLISFDIYHFDPQRPSRHPQDHHAYFNKMLSSSEKSMNLAINYDWLYNLLFIIDGEALGCDEKWVGPANEEGLYSVHFTLMNNEKEKISELVLFQKLSKKRRHISNVDFMFDILKLVDHERIILAKDECQSIDIHETNNSIIILIASDDASFIEIMTFIKSYSKNDNSKLKWFIEGQKNLAKKIVTYNGNTMIITRENLSYEEALRNAFVICDFSENTANLSSLITAGINKIPLVVREGSPLKDLCVEANAGLYFRNYEDFEGVINYLRSQSQAITIMGMNGFRHATPLYEWIKFLFGLRGYMEAE